MYPITFAAAAGEGVGGLGQIAGGASVLGDVVDGDVISVMAVAAWSVSLLAEHAVLHLVHAAGQTRRALIQLLGGAGHGVDHSLVAGLHGIERAGHLPDFIFAGQRDTRRQVAGFSTWSITSLRVLSWLSRKRISNCEAQSIASIQDQHRHRVVGEALTEHTWLRLGA